MEFDSEKQQCDAWMAVFNTLQKVRPGWTDCAGTAMDAAVITIRNLASRQQIVTPDADGWIEWKGGECPVDAEALVEVKLTGDVAQDEVKAGRLVWRHIFHNANIIAYRLAQPAKELPVTMEEDSLDATLKERGSRYGSFDKHAEITMRLKRQMRATPKWGYMEDDQMEALDMVAHKIGRILNGDPNYADSWVDIAGYAKLVADRLQGVER